MLQVIQFSVNLYKELQNTGLGFIHLVRMMVGDAKVINDSHFMKSTS